MIRPALTLSLALAVPAGAFELAWPVDCSLGETCFIQQYVDRDDGPGVQDFTCGPLSYDGHEGTDIALPSLAAMRAGVTVRAAAAGVVKGMRDGMPDIRVSDPGAPPLNGRDCGNGVVIDHGQGWETQYCHMAQGSVTARTGDRVEAGTPLGRIGLSGRTEFPHLHVTLRKDGRTLDPFDPDDSLTCDGMTAPPLWSDPPAYQPGGIIAAGFDTAVPEYDALKSGLPPREVMPATAPALVLWAYYFGNRAGDVLTLAINGPNGAILTEQIPLDRTQAQAFRAAGKRVPSADGWPVGTYQGLAILSRSGAEIDRAVVTIRIDG